MGFDGALEDQRKQFVDRGLLIGREICRVGLGTDEQPVVAPRVGHGFIYALTLGDELGGGKVSYCNIGGTGRESIEREACVACEPGYSEGLCGCALGVAVFRK